MRLIADTHAHTIASGHAYSSLKEMAYAASKNGLEVLSLTCTSNAGILSGDLFSEF